jgi:hypothetical protein
VLALGASLPLRNSHADPLNKNSARGRSRPGHSQPVVNRFRYLYDKLFVCCCLLYICNRWALKPHFHQVFLSSWFNDLLLIPCALPPLLWLHRFLGLRKQDVPPTAGEIGLHLAFWSMLFEWWGPHIFKHATGDWFDVAAYTAGGLGAWLWWNQSLIFSLLRSHEL